jgi:hypothetical protein
MVGYIKVIGRMENNMARVSFIPKKKEFGKKVSGMMVRELNGRIQLTNNFFIFLFIEISYSVIL